MVKNYRAMLMEVLENCEMREILKIVMDYKRNITDNCFHPQSAINRKNSPINVRN